MPHERLPSLASGHRPLFLGEQPGDHEDVAGEPFVGPAGKVSAPPRARRCTARRSRSGGSGAGCSTGPPRPTSYPSNHGECSPRSTRRRSCALVSATSCTPASSPTSRWPHRRWPLG